MTTGYRFRRALAAITLLAVALATTAQEPTPGTFGEVVEVRVINIEVVVTDKDGVRVPGLGSGDFRLRINGKEAPIEYFTEVRGGDAVDSGPAATPGVQNVPAAVPGEPVPTSYLLFIDDFFAVARDRDRVLRTIQTESASLPAQDRMAVVAFDGRKLTMLSSWAGAGQPLERALQEAMRRPSYGLMRISERDQADRDSLLRGRTIGGPRVGLDGRLDPFELDYAERLTDQLRNSLDALSATLRAFANPPGRKVLLLAAGSWPFSPAEYATADRFRIVTEPMIPRGADLYAPLEDTANRLGYTIYSIDLPGLSTGAGGDASIATTVGAAIADENRFARDDEQRYALQHTAHETGGKALFAASEGVLSRVTEDTRSYYWLGFTAPQKGADERYRLQVETTRPGLKVRARQGFEEVSKQRQVTMAVESALLFGSPPSSRPLQATLGKPEKAGGRTVRVPVSITVPADAVTFVPVGGELHADMEIRIAAMDSRGHRSSIPVVPYRVAAKRPPAPGDVLRKDTVLELRKEKQQVVIAVYDRTSGILMSATLDFAP